MLHIMQTAIDGDEINNFDAKFQLAADPQKKISNNFE